MPVTDFTLERLETLTPGVDVERLLGIEGASRLRAQRRSAADYDERLGDAVTLLASVRNGDPGAAAVIQAAMTTDDFPELFGDVIERMVLPGYAQWPSIWPQIASRNDLPDFRLARRIAVDGADQVLGVVPEGVDYPIRAKVASDATWQVAKYGAAMQYTWETGINDDLGALGDDSARLGRAAAKTEDRVVSGVYIGVDGPSSFYDANRVTANAALSYEAIKTALVQLANRTDPETGDPIFIQAATLVVGPALGPTAKELVSGVHFDIVAGDVTTRVSNWLQAELTVAVNPWVPAIATTNADTSWWLFANPSTGRPAIVAGGLRGMTGPEVTPPEVKRSNDTVTTYVRHVFGATEGDSLSTIASDGSGA